MMDIISKYFLLSAALVAMPGMAQETTQSGEKVNVAFRSIDRQDMLGGVNVLDYEELSKKDENTYSLSDLSGLVSGFNGASLWGNTDYLILVDGVPREANSVLPSDIAQITVMKGAQAVILYGSRGAKGAILITTKRGNKERLTINASVNTGWYGVKELPQYLHSSDYMTLYNEALRNDGLDPIYSSLDIYNYGSGKNPYRYPDVNLLSDDYIKRSYNRTEANVQFRGGGERAQYYTSVDYQNAGDLVKFGNNDERGSQSLAIRGNVDMKFNEGIKAYVNAGVSFGSNKSATGADFWQMTATLRPNRITPLIPTSYIDPNASQPTNLMKTADLYDGCFLAGSLMDQTNGVADGYAAGKNTYNYRKFEFTTGLDFDLKSLLSGLSFHTMMSIDYNTSYNTSYNNSYATYQPEWSKYNGKELITSFIVHGNDKKSGVQNMGGSNYSQTISFNAHFDYERTINESHNLFLSLLANGWQQSKSGEYHHISNVNAGFLANYNFEHRYYAELGLSAIHSARLAPGHREALNYSGTLGWNMAKENFMKGSIFNDLTLSASYSHINQDMDIDGYYYYARNIYQDAETQSGWGSINAVRSTVSKRGENLGLGFVKRNEFSVNLRGAMLNNSLTFDMSYFMSKTSDLLITPTNLYPSYFSTYYPNCSFMPYINYNADSRRGFDMSVNYKKNFGELKFGVGANLTIYTTEASKRDDTNYRDSYQYRQGQPLDALWGYECLGFFQSEEEIANAPSQKSFGSDIKPGDLRYKDQNGDGVIDDKDRVCLGKGGWYGTPTTLGVNFTLGYKNFTLFVVATGNFGAKAFKNNSYYWMHGDSKYSVEAANRWTPETRYTASMPRLTTGTGANNYQDSDFWMYSTDKISISKIQLTYDFCDKLFENKIVKGISLFASVYDLCTISKNHRILETNVGSAPQTRFMQFGAKVKL